MQSKNACTLESKSWHQRFLHPSPLCTQNGNNYHFVWYWHSEQKRIEQYRRNGTGVWPRVLLSPFGGACFQWLWFSASNSSPPCAAYMCQWSGPALVQIMSCCLFGANTDLLSIRPLGTNFSEIWIKMQNFWFVKMHLKMSSAKWRPFCSGKDELGARGKSSHCRSCQDAKVSCCVCIRVTS